MNCYNWVFKEAERYGEKWNKKWAREAAYLKILAELPEILERHAVPADKKRYSSWREFLHDFLGRGKLVKTEFNCKERNRTRKTREKGVTLGSAISFFFH